MKAALTLVFVTIASLVFGGLLGHRMGGNDRARLAAQRDQALKLADEFKDLAGKNERALVKCADTLKVMRALASGCCDEAERTLNELDDCEKAHGKAR